MHVVVTMEEASGMAREAIIRGNGSEGFNLKDFLNENV